MLRNRELRQFSILFCLVTAVTVTLGFTINTMSGILVIATATTFGVMFFKFTKTRYKSISQISDQINLVLHHADHLFIGGLDEGELSILQSEITKMTLRIREQNDTLKKEKKHLADSMADIAHQLRTPLTSINLILSLLDNHSDQNERITFIRETKELLLQMDWLLTSLLKLSRLDAGIVVFESKPIEVNSLIKAALHPFLISMELHQIALEIDIPIGVIIQGDSSWLSQAIQNIIKNCIESTGHSGLIKIGCVSNPLFTEIIIRDSGAGFEKKELSCLFDRYYRGKNTSTTGYGLGMALSKSIITRQGGIITAKNHLHGGAMFTIRFPK